MSHITKILLNILMARMRNKISPEIAEEQCVFVKDKGTRNTIYMLRTNRTRHGNQKDLYLCFIDYTKAFDKLRHEEIMSILDSLNIDGKDLRIVRNIYWEQTAAMRIGNDLSAFQDIKRGLRQGCVLSPDLFFHLQRDNHASPRRHARYKSRWIYSSTCHERTPSGPGKSVRTLQVAARHRDGRAGGGRQI